MKIFDIIPKKPAGVPAEQGRSAGVPAEQGRSAGTPADESRSSPEEQRREAPIAQHDQQPESKKAEAPETALFSRQAAPRRADALDILTVKERRPPLLEELRRRFWRRLGAPVWVTLALVVVLAAVGVVTFLYPRVTVTLTAKKSVVPLELFLTLDGATAMVVPQEGKLPGKFVSAEEEAVRTFPTAGKKKVTAKARGTLTVFNAFNARPQSLVATTRFEAPNGKIFRLTKAVTVPGAIVSDGSIKPSSVTAEVEAAEPGPAYNIGPADFTIPGFKGSAKFSGFYAKSSSPMTGGAEGETSVVKETDLAEGRRVLREELSGVLEKRARENLPEGWEIFPKSVTAEIVTATPSAAPGQPADKVELRFKLRLNAAGYRRADLEKLLGERFRPILGASEKRQVTLEAFETQDPQFDREKRTLSALINARMKVDAILEKQEVITAILGKREAALKTYLAGHEGIEMARVTFWPFWVKRVPTREDLVTVTID